MADSKSASKTYHHGNLREALIDAGIELLESQNARELTLRAVAKRAGVSHAAPYRHFDDKIALLSAIATHGFTQLLEEMRLAADRHPHDPRRALLEIGEKYVAFGVKHPAQITLMFSNLLTQGNDPELGDTASQAFNILNELVTKAQAQGVLKPGEVEEISKALWATIHGVAMLVKEGLFELIVPGSNESAAASITNQLLQGIESESD